MADTYGKSLQRQGLEELARWCQANSFPAITGIVVTAETLRPEKGFFDLYGRSIDDFAWWKEQVVGSTQKTDWPAKEAVAPRFDSHFKNFLAGFLRADARHFTTWLPHYKSTVEKIAESIRSEDAEVAFQLIWKTPDNGVADAGRGVVSFAAVDRVTEQLKAQIREIAMDPSPMTFTRHLSELTVLRDQGVLKIAPRLLLARAYAGIAPDRYHTTVDGASHAVVLAWLQEHTSFKPPSTDVWAEHASAVVHFLDGVDELADRPLVRNMFPWFIYEQATRESDGRPTLTPGYRERPAQTSAVIEAEVRSINLRHNVLSKLLHYSLVEKHAGAVVGVDQPSGSGGWVDVVMRLPDGDVWLYEIKIARTASLAIREALGQLLEYGYRGSAWRPEKLFVVAEPELDAESASYLYLLQQKFQLRLEYVQIREAA